MDALREELTSQGVIFALARVKHDLLDDLQAFGLAQKISPSHLFPTPPHSTPTAPGSVSILDRRPAARETGRTAGPGVTGPGGMTSPKRPNVPGH
jgi:hypothetical protein